MAYRDGTEPVGTSINLSDLVSSVTRALVPMLIGGLFAGATAFIVSSRMPDVYEASVTLLASRAQNPLGSQELLAPPQVDPRVYNRAIFDGNVAERAYTSVTGSAPSYARLEEFKDQISVTIDNHEISSVIKVSVRDEDSETAAEYANAVAAELVDWDRNRARHMLTETVRGLERVVEELDGELQRLTGSQESGAAAQQIAVATLREQRVRELEAARLRSSAVVAVGLLELMSQAQAIDAPVAPRVLFNTVIATAIGLLVGYGASLLNSYSSQRDARRRFNVAGADLPVLAVLPNVRTEFFKAKDDLSWLRNEVVRRVGDRRPAVIGFHSIEKGTNDNWSSAGLAYSLSRAGMKTLLIEVDFGKPKLGFSRRLVGKEGPSLEAALQSKGETRAVVRVASGPDRHFDLLPTRTNYADPSEILVPDFSGIVASLAENYDIVIVDTPPSMRRVDLSAVAPALDGVIIGFSPASSERLAAEAAGFFEALDTRVLGVVVQKRGPTVSSRGEKEGSGLPWAAGPEPTISADVVARVIPHTARR